MFAGRCKAKARSGVDKSGNAKALNREGQRGLSLALHRSMEQWQRTDESSRVRQRQSRARRYAELRSEAEQSIHGKGKARNRPDWK